MKRASPENTAVDAIWHQLSTMVWESRGDWRRKVSEASGLPFSRVRLLQRVSEQPRSLRELAELTGRDAPATTVAVNDLEARGLVERRPHPTSRRSKLVGLTDAGHVLLQQLHEHVRGDAPAAFQRLSQDDLDQLQRLLDKLVRPED